MTQKDESYILSGTQIRVLLSGLGFENVLGIFAEVDAEEHSYAKIVNALMKLVNNDVICSNGDKMHIDSKLRSIIETVGSSSHALAFSFPQSSEMLSFYLGEPSVICEPVEYQKDKYRLRCCPLDELFKDIITRQELSSLEKGAYDITENKIWNNKSSTVVFIEIFKASSLVADISVCAYAFDAPQITVNYSDGLSRTVTYSAESLMSLLYGFI